MSEIKPMLTDRQYLRYMMGEDNTVSKQGELVQIVRDEITRTKMEMEGIELSGKPNITIFALQEQLDVLEHVLSRMLLALGRS